jgi:hypothetical protein
MERFRANHPYWYAALAGLLTMFSGCLILCVLWCVCADVAHYEVAPVVRVGDIAGLALLFILAGKVI